MRYQAQALAEVFADVQALADDVNRTGIQLDETSKVFSKSVGEIAGGLKEFSIGAHGFECSISSLVNAHLKRAEAEIAKRFMDQLDKKLDPLAKRQIGIEKLLIEMQRRPWWRTLF
jgi:hypothetical protein